MCSMYESLCVRMKAKRACTCDEKSMPWFSWEIIISTTCKKWRVDVDKEAYGTTEVKVASLLILGKKMRRNKCASLKESLMSLRFKKYYEDSLYYIPMPHATWRSIVRGQKKTRNWKTGCSDSKYPARQKIPIIARTGTPPTRPC